MENLDPPSPPSPPRQIKDGKMARFCPSRGFMASSLIWGGMGVCCSIFFLSKIVANYACRLAYPEISVEAIWFKVFPTNEVIFGVQTRDCLVNPQISKPFFGQFLICWKCIEENAILVSLYFFVTTVWSRTGSASENHGGWRFCRVICTLPSLARHLAFRVRCDVGVTCRTHSCPGFSRRWLHPGSLWSNENKTTQ